jgi:hypothetical protein
LFSSSPSHPFSPIDSHTARVLFRLSFSQPPSTRDVGCLVQRPKQPCMPNFPIDFRDLGGERRQRFTLFALSLSHSFLFLFFSLFCVSDSLVTRLSHVVIPDLRLGTLWLS